MLKCRWVRFCLVYVNIVWVFVMNGCSKPYDKEFELIKHKCGLCHSIEVALNKHRDYEEWRRVIHGMKVRGLKITEREEKEVLSYLTKYYGK